MPTLSSLCQQYLQTIYRDKVLPATTTIAETYGEIFYESVEKLLAAIPLTETDIFCDLGSGLGKLVAQVMLTTPAQEGRGIEINPHLHAQALLAKQRIEQDYPALVQQGRTLSFVNGDFLTAPLTGATVALIASPCFSPLLLNSLGKRLDATPTIHTVLSLRPIATLERLHFKKTIRVECSWDTALCYVYREKK